ncbi:hypothetical protein KAX02_04460 [candidate division WOR-3 bacterium]|nr:hypothetical protein [candidate division WOR-3 bacterium]
MALFKKVLILECVPKMEEKEEGIILSELIALIHKDKVEYKRVGSKKDLFKKLVGYRYKYIHISCHGDCDENGNYYMAMPHGKVYPEDFYNQRGLRNRICFISACSLGKLNFSDLFWERAEPNILIAPQRIIKFMDVAIFWTILYYDHFYLRKSLISSYNDANGFVKNTGAMKYWYQPGWGKY